MVALDATVVSIALPHTQATLHFSSADRQWISVFLFLTYYLETIQGYSPVRTGLAFLPLTVTVLFSAGVSNTVLLPRVSPPLLVPAGLLLAAAGMALMTRIGLHSSYASPALPSLLLIGLGLGLVFAPCYSLGTSGVTDDDAGVASATINVSRQIGASIGTALLNSIAAGAAASFITAHATGGSLAGTPRTGGGAQLHRRVLGRCGDLDPRGTGRRGPAATGLG